MSVVNQRQRDIRLVIRERGWGDACIVNIIALLKNALSHINQFLRIPFDETINVHPAPVDDFVPRVLFRDCPNDPYIIRLTARDGYWAQYTYQFAHEFCHVLSNYEDLDCHPNNWFHEAICEVASIFTLQFMAKLWNSNPLYRKNPNFGDSLDKYWKDLVCCPTTHLPGSVSLHSWLLDNEDTLRVANYHFDAERKKQQLVAYKLLPLFKETPTGWNAIREFPTSTGYLMDYLIEWHSLVDAEDKPFVACISDAFGYTIT